MSDHTPVLFNVFEDWNEESVVPHISFDSIRIRFERKRPIRRSLMPISLYGLDACPVNAADKPSLDYADATADETVQHRFMVFDPPKGFTTSLVGNNLG